MLRRVLILGYGLLGYVAFLVTILYAIGFMGNLLVPKGIDTGEVVPLGEAILVNALLTGSIVTDQVANRYKREQPCISFEDYIATIGKGIPIGRMGTAQEYANLACFLASEAGSYVTGTAINLDGGACPVV